MESHVKLVMYIASAERVQDSPYTAASIKYRSTYPWTTVSVMDIERSVTLAFTYILMLNTVPSPVCWADPDVNVLRNSLSLFEMGPRESQSSTLPHYTNAVFVGRMRICPISNCRGNPDSVILTIVEAKLRQGA